MQLPDDKLSDRETKSQHCSVTYLGFSWEESANLETESEHLSSQNFTLLWQDLHKG